MAAAVDLWWIYYVRKVPYTVPLPKNKYVVIVCCDDYPRGFLVNTSVHAWIQIDGQKMAAQVPIPAANHPCLDHDSYVDCCDLYRFEEFQLQDKRSAVSEPVKGAILAAVGGSKTIIRRYRELITGRKPK